MEAIQTLVNMFVDFFSNGLLHASWWEVLLFTLVATHLTIAGVTIYLHRCQAHRSLDLGPIPSHFFRFWLWLTTGMVTKEWAAIHRKHHAKCETVDDPHSPVTRGIKAVLLTGSEMYRAEAKNLETIAKFGHGTPDDWIERNLYSRFQWQGVALMMIINLVLFGAAGATIWAVQMLWIPITAAGIINGIGHYWGYRNFEAVDASRNIMPWGIIIGGEELHNNHHTYPTSAKLSVQPYEVEIASGYIRAPAGGGWADGRQAVGQAVRVRHRLGLHPRDGDHGHGQGPQGRSATANRRRARRGRQRDAGSRHRQPLRSDGQVRPRTAPRLCRRADRAARQGRREHPARRRDARGSPLAAPRRREDPWPPAGHGRPRRRHVPGAGQAGVDARGTARAVDAHERVGRASRHRPAGLVQASRGIGHRGAARV